MNAQPATAAAVAPSTPVLLRDDVDGIAVLTLNQPQSRNSLSEAMLQALGDALTAIAHDDTVRAACAEASSAGVVEAVNFNAPSQVVIAGSKAAVEKACEIAKAKGAKRALPLSVSAPSVRYTAERSRRFLRELRAAVASAEPDIPG